MIFGIGVDIVKVERFTKTNPRFMQRVFSDYEREYINRKGNKPETMAGLFAAKEAVVKAMGTGFRNFWPNAIEILHDENGKPFVQLEDMMVHVSISRNETDAVAFVVITQNPADSM